MLSYRDACLALIAEAEVAGPNFIYLRALTHSARSFRRLGSRVKRVVRDLLYRRDRFPLAGASFVIPKLLVSLWNSSALGKISSLRVAWANALLAAKRFRRRLSDDRCAVPPRLRFISPSPADLLSLPTSLKDLCLCPFYSH